MSNVEILAGLQRRLNAFISQQQFRNAVEERLKRLGRTARIRGFRPGKVPFRVLEQQYGPSVRQEVLEESLQRSFAEAVVANKLQVAGYPQFELKTTDLNAPQIEYSATFEVYPEVKLGDISGETVTRLTFTLSDADVEAVIQSLRKQRAVFREVSRAAQEGDRVRIDFTGRLNGKTFQGGETRDFSLVLGSGRMLPDFEQALAGMQAGKTRSFDLTFPADYHDREVAGQQVTFTVTVHTVEEAQLPEVNAEFARDLGVEGGVEKLKANIRENVQREAERRVKVRNKDNALAALSRIAQLDLPQSLVQEECARLMEQAMRDMQARGMRMQKDAQLPREMFMERATRRVKLGLILAELVNQQDLAPKPEQVRALIEEYAQSYKRPEEVIRWYHANPERLRQIENLVLEDNVVAWVMANARIIQQAVTWSELAGSN